MGILVVPSSPLPPPPPPVTQETVDTVVALMKKHCAPSTWDKFTASLRARKFPFKV